MIKNIYLYAILILYKVNIHCFILYAYVQNYLNKLRNNKIPTTWCRGYFDLLRSSNPFRTLDWISIKKDFEMYQQRVALILK